MPRLSLLGCKEYPGKDMGPSLQRGQTESQHVAGRCAEPVRPGRAGPGWTWSHVGTRAVQGAGEARAA